MEKFISAKMIIVGIYVFMHMYFDNKYLKRIADTSVIACDEFISGDFINYNDKDCSNRCINKLTQWKSKIQNWLLYFGHIFISDHFNIDNYYYLLSLCKT